MAAPTTGKDYSPCVPSAEGFGLNMRYRCQVHGGYYSIENSQCQTHDVLDDIRAERARQFAKYGSNRDLEDGTGPEVRWIPGWYRAKDAEIVLRSVYGAYEADTGGPPTWMHLVLEEVSEAFAEEDPSRLREELLQVAALAVSWIEKIDARGFLS